MAELPHSPALLHLLNQIASGQLSPSDAADQVASVELRSPDSASIDGATVDLDRASRCGFGEVIFGEGKSTELMDRIVRTQRAVGQPCLITRIDPTAAAQLRRNHPDAIYNAAARTLRIDDSSESVEEPTSGTNLVDALPCRPHVAVITAGSTDAGVAEEAIETLRWMRVAHRRYDDIGVAGPNRLLSVVPSLRQASAIVVAAGMEGALPAVVAGHVAVPVIAVPTSVGYGVHLNGLTPLMGMLTSCAANVAVVNIDAGFKGGYMAGLIVSQTVAAQNQAHV